MYKGDRSLTPICCLVATFPHYKTKGEIHIVKNFVNGQITLNIAALTNLNLSEIEERLMLDIQQTFKSVSADLETLELEIESVESMDLQVVDAETGEEVYDEELV